MNETPFTKITKKAGAEPPIVPPTKKPKTWLWILITVVVTAIVVGGGSIIWQKKSYEKDTSFILYQECLDQGGEVVKICGDGYKLGDIKDMSIPFVCCRIFESAVIRDKAFLKPTDTEDTDCLGDVDCQSGEVCYNSRLCGELTPAGEDCGPQLGDLQCHKLCQSNSDCPSATPKCEEKEIWIGDAGLVKKFCVK